MTLRSRPDLKSRGRHLTKCHPGALYLAPQQEVEISLVNISQLKDELLKLLFLIIRALICFAFA